MFLLIHRTLWNLSTCLTLAHFMTLLLMKTSIAQSMFRVKTRSNGYSAKILTCSNDSLANTALLKDPTPVVGRIQCATLCARDSLCDLAAYERFPDASKSCTLLQQFGSGFGTGNVDFTSSEKCSVIWTYPCINYGVFENGICICEPKFSGERCEYINPTYCNGQWRKVYSSSTAVKPPFYANKDLERAKVKYNDTTLNATVVLRAVFVTSSATEEFSFQSHMSLEKLAWNLTAPNPKRRFVHFSYNGSYEIVTVNSASGGTPSANQGMASFDFIVRDPIYLFAFGTLPVLGTFLRLALSEGFDAFQQTSTNLYDNQSIVFQMTELYQNTYTGGHFTRPQTWYNFKINWGQGLDVAKIVIGQGTFESIQRTIISIITYLNPCWIPLSMDKSGQLQTNKLTSYLRKGHSPRVYFDNVYYSVIEVIEANAEAYFILAHRMTKTGPEQLDSMTYGVKSMVTSGGQYETCTHVIEGETVKNATSGFTASLRWFVDTKTWILAYSVHSNSSVVDGSLNLLAQLVLEGKDIRIWVKWNLEDKSRYMETQVSSVTPLGKVSTEGVVTWATNSQTLPRATLSPSCDYEYVMVTSDGYMETVTYNIFTPGTMTVVKDVMITWFAN